MASIACPEILHDPVCDAEGHDKKPDNDVCDCKNPRRIGDFCWIVRHVC